MNVFGITNTHTIDKARILNEYKYPPTYTDSNGIRHQTICQGANNDRYWNLPINGTFDFSKVKEGTTLPTLIQTTILLFLYHWK